MSFFDFFSKNRNNLLLCPYCGKFHPVDTKYCPKTGGLIKKKIDRYDAFISYRREGGFEFALNTKMMLEVKGKAVFIDLTEMQVGKFDEQLLRLIKDTPNFILILSPHCLDRCSNKSDWLKREIVHAIELKKNIIPIIMEKYEKPTPEQMRLLPECMRDIHLFQAVLDTPFSRDSTVIKILSYMITLEQEKIALKSKLETPLKIPVLHKERTIDQKPIKLQNLSTAIEPPGAKPTVRQENGSIAWESKQKHPKKKASSPAVSCENDIPLSFLDEEVLQLRTTIKPPFGTGFRIAMADEHKLFIADKNNIYCSENVGKDWKLFDRGNYNIYNLQYGSGQLFLGTDAGLKMIDLKNRETTLYPGPVIRDLTMIPHTLDHFFAIIGSKQPALAFSRDQGVTWETIWDGRIDNEWCFLESVAVEPSGDILVGGRNCKLFRFRADGTSPERIPVFAYQELVISGISCSNDNRTYIGFNGGSSPLLRSDDFGKTWIPCSKPVILTSMAAVPDDSDKLFACTYIGPYIMYTIDGGEGWTDL